MFNIVSVDFAGQPHPYIIIGGRIGEQAIGPSNPLGPEGSIYHLCLPNLGYITFSDVNDRKGLFALRENI